VSASSSSALVTGMFGAFVYQFDFMGLKYSQFLSDLFGYIAHGSTFLKGRTLTWR